MLLHVTEFVVLNKEITCIQAHALVYASRFEILDKLGSWDHLFSFGGVDMRTGSGDGGMGKRRESNYWELMQKGESFANNEYDSLTTI